jgi:hypothetical protein
MIMIEYRERKREEEGKDVLLSMFFYVAFFGDSISHEHTVYLTFVSAQKGRVVSLSL